MGGKIFTTLSVVVCSNQEKALLREKEGGRESKEGRDGGTREKETQGKRRGEKREEREFP